MRRAAFGAALLLLLAAPAPTWADRADAEASLREARAALARGRPREARIALLNAIQEDPANGRAHLLQARVYLRLGDGASAQAEVERARADGLSVGGTRPFLAHSYLMQGDARRALAEADPARMPPSVQAYGWRIRARALSALGDVDAAAQAFDAALDLAPRDPDLWVDIGRFRLDSDDMAGAIVAADRAVAHGRRNVAALVLKGEVTRSQYGLVAAMPWFDRALAVDPHDVPALIARAATLGDMGRARDMLAVTRAVLAVEDRHPGAFYLQAVLAARARNFTLARSLIERTRGALDGVPGMMLLGGAVDLELGNIERAIGRLSTLVERQPDNLAARRLLAAATWRSGDYPGVVALLRPVAQAGAADGYALALLGRAHEAMGDREEAAFWLDRAAAPLGADLPPPALALGDALAMQRARPGSPAAHVLVGDALAARGDFAAAAEAYRRAANISFTEPVALRLVAALRRSGQDVRAGVALSLFLGQNPRSAAARLTASEMMMAAGQYRRAAATLEGLRARLGDRDAALLNNLAWAYARSGQAGKALSYARAAHGLIPANPALANSYGWLLVEEGVNRPRGISLIEQAVTQAPRSAIARWHLAQAYAASGRPADARAQAESALLLPGFAEAAAAKALLAGL